MLPGCHQVVRSVTHRTDILEYDVLQVVSDCGGRLGAGHDAAEQARQHLASGGIAHAFRDHRGWRGHEGEGEWLCVSLKCGWGIVSE